MASHPYIVVIHLKSEQILDVNIWLMKAFTRGKMEIPGHFINLQRSIDIASFTFFLFDFLDETFSFTLNNTVILLYQKLEYILF